MKRKFMNCKVLREILLIMAVALLLTVFTAFNVFAENSNSDESVHNAGITDISISLRESIVVNVYTTSTGYDGAKLNIIFDGEKYEITQSDEGKFSFVGVTPLQLASELKVTMYNKNGEQVGKTKTFSVKSYLKTLLGYTYEDGACPCACSSGLKHTAMQELCVSMLNYGAAAQKHMNYNVDNLVNKDLTAEQAALATGKLSVTDTDRAVDGDAWVGAGVRFDYRIGVYFVFKAESADEYTATINGVTVTPKEYSVNGVNDKCWIIRYNDFNATNMNSVITAKLTKEGCDDQEFSYSIKSYVAAKGVEENSLAELVNATYSYGFAAVAYSANMIEIAPTFETNGSLTFESKGYDFTNTKYDVIILPALGSGLYMETIVNNGTSVAPDVVTSFALNDDYIKYTLVYQSTNCIIINDSMYSPYNLSKFKNEDITLTYDEKKGYIFDANNSVNLTGVVSYGAPLVILGEVTVSTADASWNVDGITLTVGNDSKPSKLIATSAADVTMYLTNNAQFVVAKGSEASIENSGSYSVQIGASNTDKSALIVDGKMTVNNTIGNAQAAYDTDGGEFGFAPSIYVRHGELNAINIKTNSLQVGSLKEDGAYGVLNLSGIIQFYDYNWCIRYVYANGELNAKPAVDGIHAVMYACSANSGDSIIDIRKNMTINVENNGDYKYGYFISHEYRACDYIDYLEKGVTFNLPDDDSGKSGFKYGFMCARQGTANVYTYTKEKATVVIDGAKVDVFILTVKDVLADIAEAGGGHNSHVDVLKDYFAEITYPSIVEDTVLTATGSTRQLHNLYLVKEMGTWTEATYVELVDGVEVTKTIYYLVDNSFRTLTINGEVYLYDEAEQLNNSGLNISYDEEVGYIFDAKTPQTLTGISAYGADLTILGDVTINTDAAEWLLSGITVNIGSVTEEANVVVTNTADSTVKLTKNAQMIVAKMGNISIEGSGTYSVYMGDPVNVDGSVLIVDGKMTVNSTICSDQAVYDTDGGEFGFKPRIYVRHGELNATNINTVSLQVGSLEGDGAYGVLNISGIIQFYKYSWSIRYALVNGELNAKPVGTSNLYAVMDVRCNDPEDSIIDIRKNMTITVEQNGDAKYQYFIGMTYRSCNYGIFIEDGTTINFPEDESGKDGFVYGFLGVLDGTPTVYTYSSEPVKVLIGGVETEVLLLLPIVVKEQTDLGAGHDGASVLYYSSVSYPEIAENTEIGATGNVLSIGNSYLKDEISAWEYGVYKITVDGIETVHSIYYKIVE